MSVTQRLARVSAFHPWRMIAIWGVVLLASIVAIGGLLGSALSTDQDVTSNPESKQAADLMFPSFPHETAPASTSSCTRAPSPWTRRRSKSS